MIGEIMDDATFLGIDPIVNTCEFQHGGQWRPYEEEKLYLAAAGPLPNKINLSLCMLDKHFTHLREMRPINTCYPVFLLYDIGVMIVAS